MSAGGYSCEMGDRGRDYFFTKESLVKALNSARAGISNEDIIFKASRIYNAPDPSTGLREPSTSYLVRLGGDKIINAGNMLMEALKIAEKESALRALQWISNLSQFKHRGEYRLTCELNFNLQCEACPGYNVTGEKWMEHIRGHPHRRRTYRDMGSWYYMQTDEMGGELLPRFEELQDMEFEMLHGLPSYAGLLEWRRLDMDNQRLRNQSTAAVKESLEAAYHNATIHAIIILDLEQPELDAHRAAYGYGPDPWTKANHTAAKDAMNQERNGIMVRMAARNLEEIAAGRNRQETEEMKE